MRESILILYSANDLTSLSAKERMINFLKASATSDIKYEKQTRNSYEVDFENGNKIIALPIGTPIRGMRMTHLFLAKEIFSLGNIEDYIADWCIPNMATQDMYSGVSPNDRTYVFELKNGLLNLDFYQIIVDESKN
ncbi:hypothetical protein [Bacillus phage vB_BanS-Thrax1]|nr:hypothetical protein [Bacillus phage vB_BanS-Thrax1]